MGLKIERQKEETTNQQHRSGPKRAPRNVVGTILFFEGYT
jgi:hypothetical protein